MNIVIRTKVVEICESMADTFRLVFGSVIGGSGVGALNDDFLLCQFSKDGRIIVTESDLEHIAVLANGAGLFQLDVPFEWNVCTIAREIHRAWNIAMVPDPSFLNTRLSETTAQSLSA
jgi:hypothetical protein